MSCATPLPFQALGCGTNDGGFIEFYTIPVEDVTTIPAVGAGTQTITTDLTLAVGKFWKRHKFKAQTSSLKSDPEGDDGTGGYKVVYSAQLEKYRDVLLEALRTHKGQDLLVAAVDANGTTVLMGTLLRPMRLTKDSFDSGTKNADRPMFTLEFTSQIAQPTHPPIYTGDLPTS